MRAGLGGGVRRFLRSLSAGGRCRGLEGGGGYFCKSRGSYCGGRVEMMVFGGF